MKSRILTRIISIVLSAAFLCANVPAQYWLGPQRLSALPAPTLRNRSRLPEVLGPGRANFGFVMRVGGVAFDGLARPVAGFTVNNLSLNYAAAARDGERLSVTLNNQPASAPIYDWQLIPIAKFADSDFYSCFTLFGDLEDTKQQGNVIEKGGRILNYHPSFRDTLMGLRLFQLDNLVINPYSWDLVRNSSGYVLGAGELAPTTQNKQGLLEFWRRHPNFRPDLDDQPFHSYVVSDYRRQTVFSVHADKLTLQGEPSYYFLRMSDPSDLEIEQAVAQVEKELAIQLVAVPERDTDSWLTNQLIAEVERYDHLVGDTDIIELTGLPELLQIVTAPNTEARKALLAKESRESLLGQLLVLKGLVRILKAEEVPNLSQQLSSETTLLRAINPAVWDAGVALMRYAAFFRFCKQNYPRQWRSFMSQIENAPQPRPIVITPTVMEEP